MTGRIVGRQARIPVTFPQANGPDIAVEFVMDTGFEGALTLPSAAIAALGLPKEQDIIAKLADGSETKVNAFRGVVLWHNVPVAVAVLAIDSQPLLGTALLDGNFITADWTDGGTFRIDPRP